MTSWEGREEGQGGRGEGGATKLLSARVRRVGERAGKLVVLVLAMKEKEEEEARVLVLVMEERSQKPSDTVTCQWDSMIGFFFGRNLQIHSCRD